MRKAALVIALLAMLICHLPFAPLNGSATPLHRASQIEGIDVSHADSFLPQEWGLTKTATTAVRSLAGSSFQVGLVVQHKSAASEPCARGILAAFGTQPAVSGFFYLNNLSLRC